MHIIFGKEQAELMSQRYTVLELDTFQIGSNGPVVTAYCTVENSVLIESKNLNDLCQTHRSMIQYYNNREWDRVREIASQLQGHWNNELDSFYSDLQSRAQHYKLYPPNESWTPVIQK